MEQRIKNIREICSINFHINIIKANCCNNSHSLVNNKYAYGTPCNRCKNIVCDMCCNQEKNICIVCWNSTTKNHNDHAENLLLENCGHNNMRHYMCGLCSKIVFRCYYYCINNGKFRWVDDYIVCETCWQSKNN